MIYFRDTGSVEEAPTVVHSFKDLMLDEEKKTRENLASKKNAAVAFSGPTSDSVIR